MIKISDSAVNKRSAVAMETCILSVRVPGSVSVTYQRVTVVDDAGSILVPTGQN